MNKYLMMSAAAALAATAAGEADAGTVSVHFGSASGTSYCDGLILHVNGHVYVGEHTYSNCSSTEANLLVLGLGETWKGDTVGTKNVNLADITFAYNYGENVISTYDLEIPVKAGSKWDSWVAFSATSAFIGNSGTLLLGPFAKHQGQKAESTVTTVARSMKLQRKDGR